MPSVITVGLQWGAAAGGLIWTGDLFGLQRLVKQRQKILTDVGVCTIPGNGLAKSEMDHY